MKKQSVSTKDRWGNPVEGFTLTDKEVEKVLTAHNLHMLCRGGLAWVNGYESTQGCILQVIENEPNRWSAAKINPAVASWFDQNYISTWTDEEFLAALRSAGLTKA